MTAFIQYARRELQVISHPYSDQVEKIEDVDICVWVVDHIIRSGRGRYPALAENFYQALGAYLDTPRHESPSLRGAIERLAVHFEGYLRTAVEGVFPVSNVEIVDKSGTSRGKLSESGYVSDILKELCGIEVNLWSSKENYWQNRSVEEAVYGVCFRHQQRAKHEARDYSLAKLESLAIHVLGSYLLFARWVAQNSDIESRVRERQDFARSEALLYWPEILQHQLAELRFYYPEDQDLDEQLDNLRREAARLVHEAVGMREQGVDPASEELREFYSSVEGLAQDYEMLMSDHNMREYGRELEADSYG